MKRLTTILMMLALILSSCGKEKPMTLKPDSKVYEFAKQISEKIPILDPDKNAVIIHTKKFDVHAAEFMNILILAMGPQQERFLALPKEQMVQMLTQNSERVAHQMIMIHDARSRHLKVSDTEVDTLLAQHYQRAGGEERFVEWADDIGVGMDYMRGDVERGILLGKYQDWIEKNIEVTDLELQLKYENAIKDTTATVRHILMLTQGKPDAEKKKIKREMEKVLQKAKSGEDFAELAKEYSEDPGSKDNGGLYENFHRGDMVKPFEDASFGLPVGSISDLVETRYGYHIIQVVAQNTVSMPMDSMKTELEEQVKMDKFQDALMNHLQEILPKYEMKISDFSA